MAAKGILFNTEMVRAILDGRKTCTRRIVKPQITAHYGAQRIKPPYQPGDILYVRETWGHPISLNSDKQYVFRADKIAESGFKNDSHIWHPSIHMPKEAARIWLKVTNVRVERLQDITEDGAEAEGAIDNRGFIHSPENEYDRIYTAREHFIGIWDRTIKKSDLDIYGWDANPWVWVIEFERCEKPKEV
jgi:preprotein translocase subunit SecD